MGEDGPIVSQDDDNQLRVRHVGKTIGQVHTTSPYQVNDLREWHLQTNNIKSKIYNQEPGVLIKSHDKRIVKVKCFFLSWGQSEWDSALSMDYLIKCLCLTL